TGGVFMADGSEITSLSGEVRVSGETGVTVSRISTSTSVSLVSTNGSIVDGGDSRGANIEAEQLAIYADKGIGSGNALEINVAELAAFNTSSGNIELDNVSGTLLTVTQVVDPVWGAFSGLVNQGSGGGSIQLTNQGAITIDSA